MMDAKLGGAESPNRTEFGGKVAVVVGASRGIGADTARAFARRGARLVLASRDVGGLEGVAREIEAIGGEAGVVPLDASREEDFATLAAETRRRYGRLDFAFNNQGEGFRPSDLVDVPTDAFDLVLRVSVRGTFLAMKHEIPLMLEGGGGAVVNMSSTAGLTAFRGGGPYVAAKHAVLGLTKSAALDYAQRNIRVNAVAPGPIDTYRLRNAPEAYRESTRQAVPMRRLGSGDEVAEAVVWLCSEGARFVTGTTLVVDGGRTAGFA
jgi:NAD(P)-dependent dehydrogenase (short-subunit alcohol dehydrogenase family)